MAPTRSPWKSMKSRQSCVFGQNVHSTHISELLFVFRELKDYHVTIHNTIQCPCIPQSESPVLVPWVVHYHSYRAQLVSILIFLDYFFKNISLPLCCISHAIFLHPHVWLSFFFGTQNYQYPVGWIQYIVTHFSA